MIGAERPLTPDELAELESRIDGWLAEQLVRVRGEQKAVFTIWLVLRQRNLHVETYLMPAPEENAAALYEHLLRRNLKLPDLTFAIGDEDAVYVMGEVPAVWVDGEVVDRLLGSCYSVVEQCFRPAMRIGFASRFPA